MAACLAFIYCCAIYEDWCYKCSNVFKTCSWTYINLKYMYWIDIGINELCKEKYHFTYFRVSFYIGIGIDFCLFVLFILLSEVAAPPVSFNMLFEQKREWSIVAEMVMMMRMTRMMMVMTMMKARRASQKVLVPQNWRICTFIPPRTEWNLKCGIQLKHAKNVKMAQNSEVLISISSLSINIQGLTFWWERQYLEA